MDDHFTLQWNDYQSHLMSAFTSLRNDKDFVDLTLSCEGRKISSHKMLLSACSPYFRGLLKDNPCPHPVIILRQTSYEDLVAIIHFVYNGEVSLHQSRVKSFIKTAKSLRIRGLCEASDFADEEETTSSSLQMGSQHGILLHDEQQPSRKRLKLEDEDQEGNEGTEGQEEWEGSFEYHANQTSGNDMPDESNTTTSNSVIGEVDLSKRSRSYQRRFLTKWMKIPEFAEWLMPYDKDPGRALCSFCDKTVPAKIFDIRCHGNSKRHAKMAQIRVTVLEEEEEEEPVMVTEQHTQHGKDHQQEQHSSRITIQHHSVTVDQDEVELRRAFVATPANELEDEQAAQHSTSIHIVPIEGEDHHHMVDDGKKVVEDVVVHTDEME